MKIVDTTMRDGEQKAGVAFGVKEKLEIAKIIDSMGIYQIEAGIAAMQGDEKKSIEKMMELGLNSKISSWNRTSIEDIKNSMDCNVDIIHISVPSSDLQIKSKLAKDRKWVIESIKKSIYFAKEKGYEVTVGLEDASRADINFLIKLSKIIYEANVNRIRYADTVGIMYPRIMYERIKTIKENVPLEIEVHTHNDFGMAIASSIGAVNAGAEFVNCTITGIGERAGNCNFINFIKSYNGTINECVSNERLQFLESMEKRIKNIISPKYSN